MTELQRDRLLSRTDLQFRLQLVLSCVKFRSMSFQLRRQALLGYF
jgi:hypothetical protein